MKIAPVLLALLPGLAAAAPHDAEVAVVRALYSRYAAEAVIDDTKSQNLADASAAVLRQHLTHDLTKLWLRDRECTRRTREICRIDFSPIWDSQDPVGTSVKLRWDTTQRRVLAELRRGDGSAGTLAYSLLKLKGRWRIDDIDFGPGRSSLRQLLSAALP